MTAEDVLSGRLTDTVQVGPLDSSIPYGNRADVSPMFTKASLDEAVPDTAAYWLKTLMAGLERRRAMFVTWEEYYEGDQPLAFASEKFTEAFGGRFRAFSSNFCALVVDGTRERMEVTGFDFGGKRRNERASRLWGEYELDALSQMAHTEALVKSEAYVLIEPNRGEPVVTVEDPYDAIVALDPRTRKRVAGLKRYVDDNGQLVVYLYRPTEVAVLESDGVWSPTEDFRLRLVDVRPNPLEVVPLIPLVNRPRLRKGGQSEVGPVMSNQDAINKYRADALIAAEFGAFRQRWATGLDIPEDPETGKPIEPFKSAVDRLWVVPPPDPEQPNPMETKFGEFSQTDLTPYQQMIESEVGAMSSISRMPYHYLLGQPQAVPPSGESLKSSEAGLIRKVRTQLIHFGQGWAEAMRLLLLASNDGVSRPGSTLWADPETRNEAVRTDSITKAYGTGIITRDEARAALGYDPGVPADAGQAPGQVAADDPLTQAEG